MSPAEALDALFSENELPMSDRNGALYDTIRAALTEAEATETEATQTVEKGGYRQLPNGLWLSIAQMKNGPVPIRAYYMRDNHTFCQLPLDVDAALEVLRQEFDEQGNTYGMLGGSPHGVVPSVVHAPGAGEWLRFRNAAKVWLEETVALSKPPRA